QDIEGINRSRILLKGSPSQHRLLGTRVGVRTFRKPLQGERSSHATIPPRQVVRTRWSRLHNHVSERPSDAEVGKQQRSEGNCATHPQLACGSFRNGMS